MSNYTVNEISPDERARVWESISSVPTDFDTMNLVRYSKEPGISVFLEQVWIAGVFYLGGRPVLGSNGTNQWVKSWPDIVNWLHSINEVFECSISNESTANLFMKLGGYSKVAIDGVFIVTFKKDHTDSVLSSIDLFNVTE